MKKNTLLGAFALCITLTACNSSKNAATISDTTSVPSSVHHNVPMSEATASEIKNILGEWTVTNIEGITPKSDVNVKVNFGLTDGADNDGIVQCYANGGCNSLNGQFRAGDNQTLTLTGDFAMTMMMCPGVNYDRQLAIALSKVSKYAVSNENGENVVTLMDKEGKVMVTLHKHNPEFLNGAWRIVSLSSEDVPQDAGLEMVIDLPEGKMHANGGCNVINGSIVSEPSVPDAIRFDNLISTRMMCPNISVEQKFINCLAEVNSASVGSDPGTALLKDSQGNVLIVLARVDKSQLRAD